MTEGEPLRDAFFVEPYSAKELRVHVVGGVLNGAATLAGLAWLVTSWRVQPPAWWAVLLAVAAGIYAADLVSGLLHWAFDTWFDETITFVRRMVLQVREHHVYPHRIFSIHFAHDAGTLSWIALLLTGPVILWAILGAGPGSPVAYVVAAAVTFNPLLVFMLETHKCGHRNRNPAWVRALQWSGLLLSPRHHRRHHSGNHDVNYCIINGWADRTLGRAGLFRGLEWLIARSTAAQPQRNDHEWLRRFGRKVVGRRNPRREPGAG